MLRVTTFGCRVTCLVRVASVRLLVTWWTEMRSPDRRELLVCGKLLAIMLGGFTRSLSALVHFTLHTGAGVDSVVYNIIILIYILYTQISAATSLCFPLPTASSPPFLPPPALPALPTAGRGRFGRAAQRAPAAQRWQSQQAGPHPGACTCRRQPSAGRCRGRCPPHAAARCTCPGVSILNISGQEQG
jgi:hypothetical protein